MVVAGLLLLVFGVRSMFTTQTRTHWVQTTGTVTASNVRENTGGVENSGMEYSVTFTVAYWVNGTRYSDRMARKISFSSIDDYRVGQTRTVYYDPLNPKQVALSRVDSSFGQYVMLAVGLLFLGRGLYGIWPDLVKGLRKKLGRNSSGLER